MSDSSPLLLYDGVCALCNASVRFVLRHDAGGTVRFAALQGETAQRWLADHPELAGVDSMVWIDASGRASTRSGAALAAARFIGGPWAALAAVAGVVPRALRDAVYDLVARWRYRVFGRYDTCPLPPPQQRARFLP